MIKNTFILLMIVFVSFTPNTKATHIIGGELIYECLFFDSTTGGGFYEFTVKLYRECNNWGCGGPQPNAGFDSTIFVSIYTLTDSLIKNFDVSLSLINTLDNNTSNICLSSPPNVCVEEAIYKDQFFLNPGPYYFTYQRCCRNWDIKNIVLPPCPGQPDVAYSWFLTIPDTAIAQCNSSAYFNNYPPTIICLDDTFNYNHTAIDPDGDSLVYELCAATGFDSGTWGPSPNPSLPPSAFFDVQYDSLYSPSYPIFAPIDSFKIDPQTGYLTGTPTQEGLYVVTVCVSEYRNGVLLSTNKRDFQFNVAQCDSIACDTPITGLPNEVRELNVHIYPNPNTGQFTLNVSGEAGGGIQIKIFNLFGQLILNKDLSGFQTLTGLNQQIDLSKYARGMYYVKVVTGENVFTRKIVYQ